MIKTSKRIMSVLCDNYTYQEIFQKIEDLKQQELSKHDNEETKMKIMDSAEDILEFFIILFEENNYDKALNYWSILNIDQRVFISQFCLKLYQENRRRGRT